MKIMNIYIHIYFQIDIDNFHNDHNDSGYASDAYSYTYTSGCIYT
jgi:hypothetical protein